MSTGLIKWKQLASSASPQANRSKKANQESDMCVVCKNIIKDEEECNIQCQWCNLWMHSKCSGLEDDKYKILCKTNINLIYLCTTCAPNLDEALEFFDDNKAKPTTQLLKDSLPDKQSQIIKWQQLKQNYLRPKKNCPSNYPNAMKCSTHIIIMFLSHLHL